MFAGNAFGWPYLGQAYAGTTTSATPAVDSGCKGNRLFGPPRHQPQVQRQELALRFTPSYVVVVGHPATLSLGYTPVPAVVELAARSASPTVKIRTGSALVETFHRAAPDQRTVDLDSELSGLVRDVLVALEA